MNPPPEISAGTRFDHYEVLSQIGRGGMGEVWKARDTKLARFVAIKFIPAAWAADSHAVERLRIEARATSSLNHPNICTIYDFREYEGHPLIVMELMTGETLGDRLNAAPFRTSEAVEIGIQVAEALVAAHRRGIIHRDIKPENIFLTEDGPVKVLDFGLAKRVPQALGIETTTTVDSKALTAAGGAAGTISYMSPEQASGEELDGRTDLFSLGVVLYYCATGRPPFAGKTVGLVLSSILNRAPAPPISLNPEIPPRFQEVIFNCLEKDREFRYQSAEELRAELKRVKRDLDLVHARPHGLVPDVHDDASEAAVRRSARQIPHPHSEGTDTPWKSRAARVGLILAALAVVALGIALWRGPTSSPRTLPEEATVPDPVTEQPVELAGRALRTARDSLEAGDYRGALESAEEVLGETPDNADAARIREEARAQVARFDEAIGEAQRQLDAGDPEGAQESLELARTIDPTSPVLAGLSSRLVDLLSRLNDEANDEANAAREQADAARRSAEEAGRSATPAPPAEVSPPPAPEPVTPVRTVADPPQAEPPTTVPPEVVEASPLAVAGAATDAAVPEAPEEVGTPGPGTPEPGAETEPPAAPETAGPEPAAGVADEPSRDTEADRTEIRRVVGLYERALETKSLDLLRQVKPGLSQAEIDKFTSGQLAEVEMSIIDINITPDGDRAVVQVERRDTFAVGGRPQSPPFEQTLELVRTAGGWLMDVFGQ